MRTINQDLVQEQHLAYAENIANGLSELSAATQRLLDPGENTIAVSKDLLSATESVLTGQLTTGVYSPDGLDTRKEILEAFVGISRGAMVGHQGAIALYTESGPLGIDALTPSPFYMAFQIDQVTQKTIGTTERYVLDLAESLGCRGALAELLELGRNTAGTIRELARSQATSQLERRMQAEEAPDAHYQRGQEERRAALLEESFLGPMDQIEGELVQLRIEFLRKAISGIKTFVRSRNTDSSELEATTLRHELSTGSSLESLLCITSDTIGSGSAQAIEANIASVVADGAMPPHQSILPRTLTDTDFARMSTDEQDKLLEQVVHTVVASTEERAQGYFPDEYKSVEHFREMLSLPGSKLIYEQKDDLISGFSLILTGDLPQQFQKTQNDNRQRYGDIGIFRLLCIHPEHRGGGLYDRINDKVLMEAVGAVNVVIGRVLMLPEPNKVATAHLKRGHLPLNELDRDPDSSVWALFSYSANRFLRTEDNRNKIKDITRESAKEVFEAWEELAQFA